MFSKCLNKIYLKFTPVFNVELNTGVNSSFESDESNLNNNSDDEFDVGINVDVQKQINDIQTSEKTTLWISSSSSRTGSSSSTNSSSSSSSRTGSTNSTNSTNSSFRDLQRSKDSSCEDENSSCEDENSSCEDENSSCKRVSSFRTNHAKISPIVIYKSFSDSKLRLSGPELVTKNSPNSPNVEHINDYPPKNTILFLSWLDLEEKYIYDGNAVYSSNIMNNMVMPSEYSKIKYLSTNTLLNLTEIFPNLTTIVLTSATARELLLINETNQRKIIKIAFSSEFNSSISCLYRTPNIMAINFGKKFNQPIDVIGELTLLKKIKFGEKFNQPVDILGGLKKLNIVIFGKKFNQSIFTLRNIKNISRN
jgi:hypothetical protein